MEWPGMALNKRLHGVFHKADRVGPVSWLLWLIPIAFFGMAVLFGR